MLLFTGLLIAYGPALHGHLLWDDPAHVTRPDLRSWSGLVRIWTDVRATQQYYPVVHSAFWLEHRIWGDSTFFYHWINVVWHGLSCFLLALVLRRLWFPPFPSGSTIVSRPALPPGTEWFAAGLFAFHPLAVESVAWITEQKNTLSLVFYLASAWFYIDFADRRRFLDYILSFSLFLLALESKSVTATLPAALLVVLWWRHGSLSWRRDIVPLIPWFFAAAAAGLFTAWVERAVIGAEGAGFGLSFVQRTLLASRVVWFYFWQVLWPGRLAFFYHHWDVPRESGGWVIFLGLEVLATIGLWLLRKCTRSPLAVWLLFVGSLFPALGFFNVFPFRFSYVADHFQYLANVPLLSGIAAGLASGWAKYIRGRNFRGAVAAALLLAGLATLTFTQSRLYRSNETLFRATVERTPDNGMAHHILGVALSKIPGREQDAIDELRRATALSPEYPDAHLALAASLGRVTPHAPEVIREYQRALELRPNYAEAHNDLGLELMHEPNRLGEAISHFEEAIRIRPNLVEAHQNLGDALARASGRAPEAIAQYEMAIRLRPNSPQLYYSLANVQAQMHGRESEAMQNYEHALALNPDLWEAHANLANLLVRLPGTQREAAQHYEAALLVNPSSATAHYNLAILYAQMPGRMVDATKQAEAAVQLRPDHVPSLDALGMLYAQQGRLNDARRQWTHAREVDPHDETATKNLEILNHLERH